MANITLTRLTEDDLEQFILDNQRAFKYGAMEEFGCRDDHCEEEGEIISRKTIEDSIDGGGAIVREQVVDTNGSGHGALAGFLQAARVDALICGGSGMGAQMALADAGIRLYAGVQGSADEAASALAHGKLSYDLDARCDHHGHCSDHHCQEN